MSSKKTSGQLIVISAPSGAGKSTLALKMLASLKNGSLSVSYTTRDPRPGEKAGVHYHFISENAFMKKIEGGEFLEYAKVHDQFYGTGKRDIERLLKRGKRVFLDIDVQGARQIRQKMPASQFIFILPPSLSTLRKRLKGRGTESQEVIERRMNEALNEIQACTEYDFVVINDDLKLAFLELRQIILAGANKTQHVITQPQVQRAWKNLFVSK